MSDLLTVHSVAVTLFCMLLRPPPQWQRRFVMTMSNSSAFASAPVTRHLVILSKNLKHVAHIDNYDDTVRDSSAVLLSATRSRVWNLSEQELIWNLLFNLCLKFKNKTNHINAVFPESLINTQWGKGRMKIFLLWQTPQTKSQQWEVLTCTLILPY